MSAHGSGIPKAPDDILRALDAEQREAAQATLGPVCILAGAGTGKTTAITHRIAYGVATGTYPPNRVMALTFTSKAAGELRARLQRLGVTGVSARTFHSTALAQLGFFWPQVVGGPMPGILNSKGPLIGQAAQRLRLTLDTDTLRDVAAEIEWRKVSRMSIDEYSRAGRPPLTRLELEPLLELQQAYEQLKDERRQFDFEDVLLVTAGMVESEPRVADQVRQQYRFFVVDEYQDVSPLQHLLLDLWLGERSDVCVVGDASQTIYSFAGATSRYLLQFPSKYPDATVVRLERNYRSAPPVVDVANRLMRDQPGALVLRSATERARNGGVPPVTAYDTDVAEARAVANAVAAEIRSGAAPHDIAVLYRINSQAVPLEAALADAGVSTRVAGATRFFDRPEVKQALMMLRGAVVAGTAEPLFRTVSDVLRSLGWTQDEPPSRGAVRDRWESLDALLRLAEQFGRGGVLRDFVAELDRRASTHDEPEVRAVTLTTIHAAKGLEWRSVHVVGLSEGLLPISYAKDEDAIEEERRLLYVAVTRARERLSLSWARTPRRQVERRPSRFLEELRTRTPGAPATRG